MPASLNAIRAGRSRRYRWLPITKALALYFKSIDLAVNGWQVSLKNEIETSCKVLTQRYAEDRPSHRLFEYCLSLYFAWLQPSEVRCTLVINGYKLLRTKLRYSMVTSLRRNVAGKKRAWTKAKKFDSSRVRTYAAEAIGYHCKIIQVLPINHSGMLPWFSEKALN